jgi:DNA repair photolyase
MVVASMVASIVLSAQPTLIMDIHLASILKIILCKPCAAEPLCAELSNLKYTAYVMALGASTNPYHPVKQAQRLPRRILEVLAEFNCPFGIVTKSNFLLRGKYIISPMAALGIPTGVLEAPMIPVLNETELEMLLETPLKEDLSCTHCVMLHPLLEMFNLFKEWLKIHYLNCADHVLSLVRPTRQGAMYDLQWSQVAVRSGPYADLLNQRCELAFKKHGLDTSQFQRPSHTSDPLDLFYPLIARTIVYVRPPNRNNSRGFGAECMLHRKDRANAKA